MASYAQSPNELLAALPSAAFDRLRPDLRSVPMAQGEMLMEPGGKLTHVYFPLSGAVSRTIALPDGEAIEVALIGRESTVGAYVALYGGHSYAGAVVQYPGTASAIELRRFQQALAQLPALRQAVMQHLWIDLLQSQQFAACNAAHSITQRLSRRLLCLRDLSQSEILPLTQECSARMLGVRRNSVALAASELQRARIIQASRGQVAILDPRGLAERSCDCYRVNQMIREHAIRSATPPRAVHEAML